MMSLLDLLREYGVGFVFVNVLVEQAGLPVPAVPTMLVAGALMAGSASSLGWLVVSAVLASLIADTFWYFAGRRLGMRVLRTLCRVSLSPDSCVRQTESVFARWGAASMLFAKFVPGFASVATALAGAVHIGYVRFLVFDAVGALLWVGAAVGVGYLFRDAVYDVVDTLSALGRWGLVVLVLALALYVAARWWKRWAFIRQLRMDRISVPELKALLADAPATSLLDVRSPMSQALTGRIPGARTIDVDAAIERLHEVPIDDEVIVYCACPNDASAVRVAQRLRAAGFKRVRPLAGGIDAWVAAGHAVEH